MLMILSYYSDGSGPPEVKFFSMDNAESVTQAVAYAIRQATLATNIRVFHISALNQEPHEVKLRDGNVPFDCSLPF